MTMTTILPLKFKVPFNYWRNGATKSPHFSSFIRATDFTTVHQSRNDGFLGIHHPLCI
jgi:hypothetical protein